VSLILTAHWQARVEISFLKGVQDELENYQATWKYLAKMGNGNRTTKHHAKSIQI
jgi:hypothetical protein